jgi:hypothetical protein
MHVLLECEIVITNEISFYRATDCINGTLAKESEIPKPFMNFTTFWSIVEKSTKLLDPKERFIPMQSVLTIYNSSRLYINLEACVNTLRGECLEFLTTHGNDGDNQTAQSRFHCFYNKVFKYSTYYPLNELKRRKET